MKVSDLHKLTAQVIKKYPSAAVSIDGSCDELVFKVNNRSVFMIDLEAETVSSDLDVFLGRDAVQPAPKKTTRKTKSEKTRFSDL